MKIKPPGSPGSVGIDKIASVDHKEPASEATDVGAALNTGDLESVVQALEAGTIQGPEAVDRIIELAVSRAETAGVDPSGIAELRSNLLDFIENDPYLKSLVSRLGE